MGEEGNGGRENLVKRLVEYQRKDNSDSYSKWVVTQDFLVIVGNGWILGSLRL